MQLSRRGLFAGLAASLAAPSIVRIASLMPVRVPPLLVPRYNGLMTADMITREFVRLWKNTSAFMGHLGQEDGEYASILVPIGQRPMVRRSQDYTIVS